MVENKLGEITLKCFGKIFDLDIIQTKYRANDAICVRLHDSNTHEPFGVLSVNLPDCSDMIENKNQFFAKCWSENEVFADQLRDSKFFKYTGMKFLYNFVEVEIWEIKNDTQ